jgi:hypothetical protein
MKKINTSDSISEAFRSGNIPRNLGAVVFLVLFAVISFVTVGYAAA